MRRSIRFSAIILLLVLFLPVPGAIAQSTTDTQVFRWNEPECTHYSGTDGATLTICMEGTLVLHTTSLPGGGYNMVSQYDLDLTYEGSQGGCTGYETQTRKEHHHAIVLTTVGEEVVAQESHVIALDDGTVTESCEDGQQKNWHCVTNIRAHYVEGEPQFASMETVCDDPVPA